MISDLQKYFIENYFACVFSVSGLFHHCNMYGKCFSFNCLKRSFFCQTGEKMSIDFCFGIEKGEVGYESTYRGSRFFGFD